MNFGAWIRADENKKEMMRETHMKKQNILLRLVIIMIALSFCIALNPAPAQAAAKKKKYTTTYKGVDYARVYNFRYYMKKYPSVKKKVKNNPKKAIKYFVQKGMAKGHRACASFDVKSYYRGNPQLRKKFGKNYKKYYLYYINGGYKEKNAKKTATGVKKMVYEASGKKEKDSKEATVNVTSSSVTINSCKISGEKVIIKATVNNLNKGTLLSLFALPSYTKSISSQKSISTVKVSGSTITCSAPLNLDTVNSVLQKKFLFAYGSGTKWKIASNSFYIQNPQAAAKIKTAFPKPARGTKKGLKSQILTSEFINKIFELNCSNVAVDFPIQTFLGGSGVTYKYNGKTYHFSSAILDYQAALKKLCKKGIVVTGVFYLSDRNLTKYMPPEAAIASRDASTTFNLNTSNSTRLELEALFSCLADYFCSDGALVANWIFGNEIDQYIRYNFSGDVSYSKYIQYYADGFRMFNTAVKSRYKNARTYFSFDHNWNLSFELAGTYRGKMVLADIHSYLKKHGAIHWDIALNPYPSPELDPRFWKLSPLVTISPDSQQFTMMTMRELSAWIKKTYGKDVHIILPEVGISSNYQGQEMEEEQAAAIALAYYLAEFDPNIDLFVIQREKNDPAEEARNFHVSLYRASFSNPKKAVDVFSDMDTPRWNTATKKYLQYIGSGMTWKKLVPGFNGARFE